MEFLNHLNILLEWKFHYVEKMIYSLWDWRKV